MYSLIYSNSFTEEEENFQEWRIHLIDKDYGYMSTEILNLGNEIEFSDYETPELINNCIIDLDSKSNIDFGEIFNQLSSLSCKFIEIRIYETIDLSQLLRDINKLNEGPFRNCQIYIPYSKNVVSVANKFLNSSQIIGQVCIHSTPIELNYTESDRIMFSHQIISSEDCCGHISPEYFSAALEVFSESLKYNSCLNKKIAIDKRGFIKNCPSLNFSFGHISNSKLTDILQNKEFSALWNLSKDKIEVCKDCEFRYVCTDCRANVKSQNAKPSKCSYDPYNGVWLD